MVLSPLVVAVATAFSTLVLGDPGAIPANIPLAFDAATRRYVASVLMGPQDNQQTAGFTISTGLRYSAVASSNYPAFAEAKTHVYNPSLSSTFQAVAGTAANSYGGLDLGGGLGREDCGLKQITADVAPWSWPNQTLVLSNASQSALSLFSDNITGVMGLATSAPPGGSVLDTVLGHWFQIHTPNTTFEYGMALDDLSSTLAKQQGTADNGAAGHLHMLAPNTTFFDPVQVVWSGASSALIGGSASDDTSSAPPSPQSSSLFTSDFAFDLQGWTFTGPNSFSISSGEVSKATFEPLYPAMIFPSHYAKTIYAALGSDAQIIPNVSPTQWTVSCSLAGISWTPKFNTLTLPMTNLVQRDGDRCVGAIQAWSDDSATGYLLGSPAMANAYIIHQTSRTGQNQVGVAPRLPLVARSGGSKKALIGGLVGGLVGGLLLLGVLLFIFRKKINRSERTFANQTAEVNAFVLPVGPTTPSTAGFRSNPFSTPPASAALTTSTSSGTFAQQQSAAMRDAKGRNLYTQAAPSVYQPSMYYQPSTIESHSPAEGPSASDHPVRSPLLPPAYESPPQV
ncbi:hypothetical protein EXIGLDRAFT_760343 [Exidia glandulosa HHB12029]|uniref:Peptidase A1 domain-containing protein n=1 Tax=Exidia glandulosa HHB12029 TaxID=1314781 RepID=A0A165PG28_EXIGL|nr:hypothetical protein EXIGLDRAFT_760343 [Exidia glandulosa HHB12029]